MCDIYMMMWHSCGDVWCEELPNHLIMLPSLFRWLAFLQPFVCSLYPYLHMIRSVTSLRVKKGMLVYMLISNYFVIWCIIHCAVRLLYTFHSWDIVLKLMDRGVCEGITMVWWTFARRHLCYVRSWVCSCFVIFFVCGVNVFFPDLTELEPWHEWSCVSANKSLLYAWEDIWLCFFFC